MHESDAKALLIKLLKQDTFRLKVLKCLQQINLPTAFIAAGFVRNMAWDHMHNIQTSLNDIDVIYFDPSEKLNSRESRPAITTQNAPQFYEKQLGKLLPNVNWQVKNQALMHKRNNHAAYPSLLAAMHYWPEQETAIAVRLAKNNQVEIISAFGLARLFELTISHNPAADKTIFNHRVSSKSWLSTWPQLRIIYS